MFTSITSAVLVPDTSADAVIAVRDAASARNSATLRMAGRGRRVGCGSIDRMGRIEGSLFTADCLPLMTGKSGGVPVGQYRPLYNVRAEVKARGIDTLRKSFDDSRPARARVRHFINESKMTRAVEFLFLAAAPSGEPTPGHR